MPHPQKKKPGRPPIIDEFSDLPFSKQYRWALRQKKKGKCAICGAPAVGKVYCLLHMIKERERQRARKKTVSRRPNAFSYRTSIRPLPA